MRIEKIIVGNLETNCYLVIKGSRVLIIDPGDEPEKIINEIDNLDCVGILLTHHHFDHVGALDKLLSYYKVNLYDRNNLKEGTNNIDVFNFEVIYTPGHTSDSISYYFKDVNILFSGDFIFKDSIGRTDLGGNDLEMFDSINRIKKYDRNIIIKPGHGDDTTLCHEIDYNPFFN